MRARFVDDMLEYEVDLGPAARVAAMPGGLTPEHIAEVRQRWNPGYGSDGFTGRFAHYKGAIYRGLGRVFLSTVHSTGFGSAFRGEVVVYVLEGQEETGPYWMRRVKDWQDTIPRFATLALT